MPPPVAPPFIPNTGPKEGSRSVKTEFFPIFLSPSAIAIDIVVLPSPRGVGFIAVTNINLPSFLLDFSNTSFEILALYLPYISKYSSLIPSFFPILSIVSNLAFLDISISVILSPI